MRMCMNHLSNAWQVSSAHNVSMVMLQGECFQQLFVVMAFRSSAKRNEIKKSSYYLWFLGAKESHGLRGDSYIRPGLRYLIEREREIEPIKVTLQVSNKGLKIVQNVSSSSSIPRSNIKNGLLSSGKGEVVKHFIPHDAITCVIQGEPPQDDLVACILLLYNPVTRCPIHVHAYRCDSVETATVLRRQLQTLTEHPDTQQKMAELEQRLEGRCCERQQYRKLTGTSDGRSRGDSESSGSEREIAPHQGIPQLNAQNQPLDERTAHLYASLAAELREKLKGGKSQVPILLPPRDYDTMHRTRGKLDGIDTRKSLQANVVGPNGIFSRRLRPMDQPKDDSSGKSSGIGSDEAPSSPPRGRRSTKEREEGVSSSEDEWEMQRQLRAKAARELLHWKPSTESSSFKESRVKMAAHVDSSRSRPQSSDWRQQAAPCRVLPRISPKSPPRINAYHELPEEKRYPGLDRESARMHYSEHGSDRRIMNQQRFSYTEPNGYHKERRRMSDARDY
uniref:PID domain-containing protein n=1 Tax=Strigamia maritima TaxID=126957 RepID=T1J2M3_STRMM